MTTTTEGRRVRLISLAPAIIEPDNRRFTLHAAGFEGIYGGRPDMPFIDTHWGPEVAGSEREIGRVTDVRVEGANLAGTLRPFPAGATSAATRWREISPLGSDRVSVRLLPLEKHREGDVTHIDRWQVGHLAAVSEPADPHAGDQLALSGAEYIDLTVELEGDLNMTTNQPNGADVGATAVAILDQVAARLKPTVGLEDRAHMAGVLAGMSGGDNDAELTGWIAQQVQNLASHDTIPTREDFQRAAYQQQQAFSERQRARRRDEFQPQPTGVPWDSVAEGLRGSAAARQQPVFLESEELVRTASFRHPDNSICLPLSSLTEDLALRVGTAAGSAGSGAGLPPVETSELFDTASRESAAIDALLGRVFRVMPGPGDYRLRGLKIPQAGWQSEPTNSGYTLNDDPEVVSQLLKPRLLVSYMTTTRLAELQSGTTPTSGPELTASLLTFAADDIMERLMLAILGPPAAADANRPTSLYATDGIGSSADLSADWTLADVDAALSASRLAGPGRTLFAPPEQATVLRSLARIAGVTPLVEDMDGMEYIVGGAGGRCRLVEVGGWADSKTRRGLVVDPASNVALREWDGGIYFARYQNAAGVEVIGVEMVTDWALYRPSEAYRLRED